MNTKDFIEKAKSLHGDKYDYSKVEYVNTKTKVCIICPKHGEFWITPHNHIQHRGCKLCGEEAKQHSWENVDINKIREKNFNNFILKARKKHGYKYDYSKVKYIDNLTKVLIICPEHGEFLITPKQHLIGCGCYECAKKEFSNKKRVGIDKFIERSTNIHGNKYIYSKVEYVSTQKKVCIICPEHGEFWQTPSAHIHLKEGCPKCSESHLERKIRNELDYYAVTYMCECSRDTLPWLNLQTLDFYLPEKNIAIECQGRQHFSEKAFSGKSKKRDFEYQVNNDILKEEKCKKNGVKLYYIVDNVSYALNSGIPIYNLKNTFTNLNNIING